MLKETLITMSRQELERLKVVEKVISGPLTQVAAAKMLGLSVRQVKRLCSAYRVEGGSGLISKHRGKISNRGFSQSFKDGVMEIIRDQYSDFGPTFAAEKLLERQGVKVNHETLRLWMIEDGLWKSKRANKARIHQTRNRRLRLGELVQIDGSYHDWFEGRASKCCLLVFIDDATSNIMQIRFEHAETTAGYFMAIGDYIRLHGKPIAWYSDKHGIFRINQIEAPDNQTQFERAMEQLDIQIICANSPQAKGRVERANKTLQDRLIKEMRLRNISSMEQANAYLPEFIAAHNARFARPPGCTENAHRPNTHTLTELESILSHQYVRTLSRNLEFSFENKLYQITCEGKGYRLRGAKLTVLVNLAGQVSIQHNSKPLAFKTIEKSLTKPPIMDKKGIMASLDKQTLNSKKAHKPSKNHPWKSFPHPSNAKSNDQKGTFLNCSEGDISILP